MKLFAEDKKILASFNDLLLHTPIAIAIFRGSNYVIELANDKALGIIIKDRSCIGMPLFKAMPQLEHPAKEIFDKVMQTGIPFKVDEMELSLFRNGKAGTAWFIVNYEPIRDDDNTISGILLSANEVTIQVLARKKIEDSEKRYNMMLMKSPFAFAVLKEKDLIIDLANDQIKEVWGRGNDIEGKSLLEIMPELKDTAFLDMLDGVRTTGIPFHGIEVESPKNMHGHLKEEYFFNFVFQPYLETDQTISGITIIGNEVTEQVIAKRKIEESEEHFRLMADLMPAKVSNRDAAGNVTYFNKHWLDFSGCTFEELKDFGYQKIMHPNEIEEFTQRLKKAAETGTDAIMEMRFKNKKGEYIWHLNIASPIKDNSGELKMWVGVTTEMHHQKEQREVLELAVAERTIELSLANQELVYQNEEKENRAAELVVANQELVYQNEEKENRAAELVDANKELFYQNEEKEKRAAELVLANEELVYQNEEKEKRAAELIIANYARSLIEASLDPLVTISATGKILDVNEASVKVTGVPREKLIDTDFSNYFTEPEKANEGYRQVFAKGFVADYPLTIKHKNGNFTDVLYNASVYKDDKGNVLGVFAAARDVTEQKKSSQYARSLIEASLDPLVTISAAGKILDVNEASVKVTGVPREKLIGTDFSNYFTDPEKAKEGYHQVFEKGFVADYPLTIKHKNGNLTDVLYNASVYKDGKGNVLGVFAAARDVTEQKWAKDLRIANKELVFQNEEKEKRAAELVVANKELESFNYISSHDLQEPLRKIRIMAGRILEKENQNLSDNGKNYFHLMQNAAQRMQTLIQDLLSFSRLSMAERNFETTDLNIIIEEVKEEFKDNIAEKNAVIEVKEICDVNIIPFQFRQLMHNIISNALKFSNPNIAPHIKISSVNITYNKINTLNLTPHKEYCHISISDNGIGFEKEFAEKIFEVFQKLHAKDEYAGTGIGLAIVKKIVENHKGIITATSELKKGTTFNIYIPS